VVVLNECKVEPAGGQGLGIPSFTEPATVIAEPTRRQNPDVTKFCFFGFQRTRILPIVGLA
jgi:hypothetical protein